MGRKRKQRGGNFKGKKYQRSKKQDGGNFFTKLRKNPFSQKLLTAGKQLALGALGGPQQTQARNVRPPPPMPARKNYQQRGAGIKKKRKGHAKLRNTIPSAKHVMYHQ
ncbi:Hypothetical predicted protein [Paramuricea clavata]|uniref:Uncharacterized protein n=1 Tax=Paramuricea clavata TaxID=317549 RepID=A0A6S7GFN3_PARCT|nr:Hypothetical predicted protein [Paramuricea clavata]